MKQKNCILPIIIIVQFACTSLWFAGNAIINDLIEKTGLGIEIIGYVLSSLQIGFIVGTLVFAILMIADRYSPSKVFMICALMAALCNSDLLTADISKCFATRFGIGFFLAGIYPESLKISADLYEKGLLEKQLWSCNGDPDQSSFEYPNLEKQLWNIFMILGIGPIIGLLLMPNRRS